MAASAPTSSIILGGDGAPAAPLLASLPDFSPVSSTGYPRGLDPELVSRYVVLFPFFLFLSPLFFILDFQILSGFIPWFKYLFLRFERFQLAGGGSDFGSFVVNSFVDSMPDEDFEVLRQRRSGSSKAAQHKRDQAVKDKGKLQAYKLAASSVDGLGFQVLSPLLFTMN